MEGDGCCVRFRGDGSQTCDAMVDDGSREPPVELPSDADPAAGRPLPAHTMGGKVIVPVEIWGMGDPTLDRAGQRLTKAALCVAAATAVALLTLSTVGLQWAHTYRQWSGEGLAFLWVAMGLVVASAGASFSVAVLLWARARTSPRHERFYAVIAAVLVVLVIGAVTFAVYAESRGQPCFGPCG